LFHVVDILANVFTTIWPFKGTVSFHLVVAPLAGEYSSIGPFVNPGAVDIVIIELSSVGAIVSPREFALAVFLALEVLALV
jgi:hypothetical protein